MNTEKKKESSQGFDLCLFLLARGRGGKLSLPEDFQWRGRHRSEEDIEQSVNARRLPQALVRQWKMEMEAPFKRTLKEKGMS